MSPHHLPKIIVGEDSHGVCKLSLNLRWEWICTIPKNEITQPMSIGQLTTASESLSNSILNLRNNEIPNIKLPLRHEVIYEPLVNASESLTISWPG